MYNYRLACLLCPLLFLSFHMQDVLLKIDEYLQCATVTVHPLTFLFSSYNHLTCLLQV